MAALVKARLSPGVKRRGALGNSRLMTAPVVKPQKAKRRRPSAPVVSATRPSVTRTTISGTKFPVAPPPRYSV